MSDAEDKLLIKAVTAKMVEELDKVFYIAAKIIVINEKYGDLSQGAFSTMLTDFEKLILTKISSYIPVAESNMPSFEAKVINKFMGVTNGRPN